MRVRLDKGYMRLPRLVFKRRVTPEHKTTAKRRPPSAGDASKHSSLRCLLSQNNRHKVSGSFSNLKTNGRLNRVHCEGAGASTYRKMKWPISIVARL